MDHSFTTSAEFFNFKNRTISYDNDGSTIIPNFSLDSYAPSGSMTSTIDDMTIWTKMLVNSGTHNKEEFLSKKQFNFLTSPLAVTNALNKTFYGIGWEIDTNKNIIYHNGSTAGQRSRLTFNPEKGYGFVILTNQQSDLANALDYYATEIFLKNKLERIDEIDSHVENKSKSKSKSSKSEEYFINDKKTLKKIKTLKGIYTHPAYGNVEISKIKKNQYSFVYSDFKGTIKHNEDLEFTAYLNHFTGKDQIDFKIIYEMEKIKSIIVNIPYSEPLAFIKN